MKPYFYYLILVNLLALLLCAADKRRARRHRWRIPEAALFLLAALGGAPGLLCGMFLFRHKTRQLRFTLGVPLILLAELALWYYFLYPALP